MSSPAVRGGIHDPFAGEAHVTIQSLWTGPIVAGKDGARLSFWRCVVAAIGGAAEKGGCCREGISPASCREPRQEQTTGSDPNRGMALDEAPNVGLRFVRPPRCIRI
jgi:hypothetical protein